MLLSAAQAAPDPSYATTYDISLNPDGSALWSLEYRTLLPSDAAVAEFRNEMQNPRAITPLDVQRVMERSAAAASEVTGRNMSISNVTVTSSVETTPTGTFGVIEYTLMWTGFCSGGDQLQVGDVFPVGLYLPHDTALVVRPPPGYSVAEVSPPPDNDKGSLTWYGLRAFRAGQPRVVLAPASSPMIPVVVAAACLVGGFVLFWQWSRRKKSAVLEPGSPEELPDDVLPLLTPPDQQSEADLQKIEDRILHILNENGGELFQGEIARQLDAPKSTVSKALNVLHSKGMIQKVRKGRENLIRRV